MDDINAALTQFAAAEQAMLAARGAADARSWLLGIDRAELLLKRKRGAESRQLAATILNNVADKLDPDSPLLARLRVLANAD